MVTGAEGLNFSPPPHFLCGALIVPHEGRWFAETIWGCPRKLVRDNDNESSDLVSFSQLDQVFPEISKDVMAMASAIAGILRDKYESSGAGLNRISKRIDINQRAVKICMRVGSPLTSSILLRW